MTYIKWKDEVESYLNGLPTEEKAKVFSYFSEMYADKREAGESEEQIIEEFGAPYDVARRILEGNKESAPETGTQSVSGGNNYNYNYYNYNYGGSPTPPPAAQTNAGNTARQEQPQEPQAQAQAATAPDPFGEGLKVPSEAKKKKSDNRAAEIILTFLFVLFAICAVGISVAVLIDGFSYIGMALGAAAASNATAGEATATVGYGLITVGIGFLLFAASSALIAFLSKKLKKFKGKE